MLGPPMGQGPAASRDTTTRWRLRGRNVGITFVSGI